MTQTTTGNTLFSQAVCLLVEFRRLGTRRKVSTTQVDTHGADPDLVHVSKEILESKKLDAIGSADSDLKAFLRRRCTPSPMFRGGIFLLPNRLITEVDARLQAAECHRGELVDAFLAEYNTLQATAQDRLGPLYDVTQYPPEATVRRTFGMRWQYLTVDTPATLSEIKAEIFVREQAKAAAQWSDALDEAQQVIRAAFADLVDHMVERLIPDGGAKPKTFRNSLVANFKDFLETFSARNLANDDALATLVTEARRVLSGIEPDELRKHADLRAAVAANFSAIKSTLDTMMIDRPSRRYGADTEE